MLSKEQLLDLKERVDKAKTTVSELTGQKNAMMKQLKDDWGCDSIQAAKKKLEKMNTSITNLDEKIQTSIAELEEKYNLNE